MRTVLLRVVGRGSRLLLPPRLGRGAELAARPAAALTLTWPGLFRAIRVRGGRRNSTVAWSPLLHIAAVGSRISAWTSDRRNRSRGVPISSSGMPSRPPLAGHRLRGRRPGPAAMGRVPDVPERWSSGAAGPTAPTTGTSSAGSHRGRSRTRRRGRGSEGSRDASRTGGGRRRGALPAAVGCGGGIRSGRSSKVSATARRFPSSPPRAATRGERGRRGVRRRPARDRPVGHLAAGRVAHRDVWRTPGDDRRLRCRGALAAAVARWHPPSGCSPRRPSLTGMTWSVPPLARQGLHDRRRAAGHARGARRRWAGRTGRQLVGPLLGALVIAQWGSAAFRAGASSRPWRPWCWCCACLTWARTHGRRPVTTRRRCGGARAHRHTLATIGLGRRRSRPCARDPVVGRALWADHPDCRRRRCRSCSRSGRRWRSCCSIRRVGDGPLAGGHGSRCRRRWRWHAG